MSFVHQHLALLVTAAVALAIALLARGVFLGYPGPRLQGSIFSAKEQAIVAACAETLFPAQGPIPLSGTEAGLVAYMDLYVKRLGRTQELLIKLLFWSIEHGPWIFGLKGRFTSLSHDDRMKMLARMARSPIYFRRISFLSMRAMLTMGYLAHPEVAKAMGMIARKAPFEENPAEAA